MRHVMRSALVLSIAWAACLTTGCSDDSTGPGDTGPVPGEHVWSARFGDADQQIGYAVAVEAVGDMIVTGSFGGSIDFGGGVLMNAGAGDVCLVKLAP